MATALTSIKQGNKTYYISYSGDTLYYSTEGPGKGSVTIKGARFKNNQIINTSTNKPIANDYELLRIMGK